MGGTVEVWEWISNFILYIIIDVITYLCWDWSQNMLVKGPPDDNASTRKHITVSLWGHSAGHRWILLTKCQQCGPFYVIPDNQLNRHSSCWLRIMKRHCYEETKGLSPTYHYSDATWAFRTVHIWPLTRWYLPVLDAGAFYMTIKGGSLWDMKLCQMRVHTV